MGDDLMNQFFQAMQVQHFQGLCRNLGLSDESLVANSQFAVASAAAGNVRVFFEHERGLCFFWPGRHRRREGSVQCRGSGRTIPPNPIDVTGAPAP